MRKWIMTCVIILVVLLPTITAIAGDIPESLLHSEDAEIFFGEVIAYHPDKENPDFIERGWCQWLLIRI